MKKILVLGGTRFFGVHLVNSLLRDGHSVVVASRGNTTPEFIGSVQFETADRNKLEDLERLAALGPFDLIYDQICMSAKNAMDACDAFKGNCTRYIFTSTGSVYDSADGALLTEALYDPKKKTVNLKDTDPYDYQEAKRQAEAVFSQYASFEVAMVRFPIVLGTDDYTHRLKFHVDSVKNNKAVYFPNIDIRMGFIKSDEAGEFLNYIGKHSFTGSVNAVSSQFISLRELMMLIEEKSGKEMIIAKEEGESNHSPFGFAHDFMIPNILGESLGFRFNYLLDYLPKLIDHYL